MIEQIQRVDQFAQGIQKEKVLVEFFATWCKYCKAEMPVVEQYAQANPDVLVMQVDVDKFPALVEKYHVELWPNFFAFSNGKIVDHKPGSQPIEALEAMVR
ncbi:thioredoxin family protein [Dubosiella muris]|uniref:Thioredoxin n=1 Tax=Dubosiella muris TaxID=3038133 RepID=A0AC61R762_9FIRM|nr:thioredoxin family protein [Dubosiella muris]TGY65686.1 thioredoxin [Dubosiella muris]